MYTLRTFRANTKKAFDDAFEGHQVVITRGKDKFQLVSLVDKPLPGHSFDSTPTKVVRIEIKKNSEPTPSVETNHPPADEPIQKRTKGAILDEINARKELLAEDLANNQDAEYARTLNKDAAADLDALWKEYRLLG